MKNRTACVVTLAFLCFVVAAIAVAASGGVEKGTIEERVAQLEKAVVRLQARVDQLEKNDRAPRLVPPGTPGQKEAKPDILPWRQLQKGMTRDQVKKLLGEPKHIMTLNEYEVWDYAGGGSIRFDRSSRVEGWYEP